ncbi:MAG: hypothetical protein K2J65_02025, partial [Duncaniella sp.]|nr:hypothetical protein [Duncaniella sp.]
RGTKWVEADRLRSRVRDFGFKNKKDNIIGLQIADLIAYPVTIHLLHPERNNPSYEAVKRRMVINLCLGVKPKEPKWGTLVVTLKRIATERKIYSWWRFDILAYLFLK